MFLKVWGKCALVPRCRLKVAEAHLIPNPPAGRTVAANPLSTMVTIGLELAWS